MERLKRLVRRTPALFWLAGLIRYLDFGRQLRAANARHRARPADARLPLPPPALRHRVHNALDEASFLDGGAVVHATLMETLADAGLALDGLRILDFACGCGRVLRHFEPLRGRVRLHGSDIDAEAIGWCSAHLADLAACEVNAPAPPTRHPDGAFDVVYSISLFTHLDEAAQHAWLQELSRLVAPGGVLIATVHGALCHGLCYPEERTALERTGFVFRRGHTGRFKLDGLPDDYQTTFHTRDYVLREWSRYLPVAHYLEGGLNRHQDLVVLRRPPVA